MYAALEKFLAKHALKEGKKLFVEIEAKKPEEEEEEKEKSPRKSVSRIKAN